MKRGVGDPKLRQLSLVSRGLLVSTGRVAGGQETWEDPSGHKSSIPTNPARSRRHLDGTAQGAQQRLENEAELPKLQSLSPLLPLCRLLTAQQGDRDPAWHNMGQGEGTIMVI